MAGGQMAAGAGTQARGGWRRAWPRLAVAVAAAAAIAVALVMLTREGAGIDRTELEIGQIPATLYALPGTQGAPLVVVAHGFAGSRQFMQSFSLTLARAGYAALAFDFAGHGDNRVPMSRDVNSVDGTTRLLMDETHRVIEAGKDLPQAGGGVALLGHSMATDVIVRTAAERGDVDAVVAVSMYSEAVTETHPQRLLMVTGAWEPPLREASVENLRMVAPEAEEGETVRAGDVVRRAVVAPRVEHVGVLYSGTTLREARDWLDAAFERDSGDAAIARRGPWVALLMGGIVALAWPLFSALPARVAAPVPSWRALAVGCAVPMLAAPLLLWPVETDVLPVLIADYLALHLGLYGLIQLAVLWALGYRLPRGPVWPAAALAAWTIGVFGLALDTFGASFMPHAGRLAIVGAVALGAVPFMLGDAVAIAGGRAPLLRRLAVRAAFLASLAIAVALDYEGLFFLILILPIIVLFFLVYGTIGAWVGRRAGPLASGLALGLALAWAIGVSFPLFAA